MSLSAMSMRSLLDSISSRLDEGREISRYLIGLLIFLGLLGTFWGLLQTIDSVGNTIATLSPAGDDFSRFFSDLQAGLEAPLAGMGIAFSSSLFGLAGSLVLGFLELQAGQAQSRFYMDFEEWLSSHTRLARWGGGAGGRGLGADLCPGAAGADRRKSRQPAAGDRAGRGRPREQPGGDHGAFGWSGPISPTRCGASRNSFAA